MLEVMVVLVILSMVGVVVGVQVTQQFDRAKVELASLQLRQIQNALTLFEIDVRRYPTEAEGVAALLSMPEAAQNWRGPYLRNDEILLDPWGHPISYQNGDDHFVLASLGADRSDGGEGVAADIRITDAD